MGLIGLVTTLFRFSVGLWILAIRIAFQTSLQTVRVLLVFVPFYRTTQCSKAQSCHKDSLLSASAGQTDSEAHAVSTSHGGRNVKMRFRSSLRKRKEQILLFGSATRPASPDLVSVSSRVRTTSEAQESDDQVMPLPIIRSRSRRWKSCGSVPSTLSVAAAVSAGSGSASSAGCASLPTSPPPTGRRWHGSSVSRPLPEPVLAALTSASASALSSTPTSASVRIDDRTRRTLLQLRRQGRQLSDPSEYKSAASKLAASSAASGSRGGAPSSPPSPRTTRTPRSNSNSSSSSSSSSESSSATESDAEGAKTTYCVVVSGKSSKFLVEQNVIKSAQRGP